MARSKTHKTDEDLKGELKEALTENKILRRRLKKLERSRHVYEQFNLDSDEKVSKKKQEKEEVCPNCAKSVIVLLDLGPGGCYNICTTCSMRKKLVDNG